MRTQTTWILIADGAQARVFEHQGPGKGLVPVKGLNIEEEHLRNQDIVTDRPGRSFSSVGSGRSAMEPRTDPKEQRETNFVKSLATMLEEHRANGRYERLIIAAAPVALGELRPALSEGVKKATVAELAKDLTNIPTAKLGSHFDALLAL